MAIQLDSVGCLGKAVGELEQRQTFIWVNKLEMCNSIFINGANRVHGAKMGVPSRKDLYSPLHRKGSYLVCVSIMYN